MSLALISVAELKAALHDGEELALLDAREEVPFDKRHLLMASCLPLGRIELLASELLPREDVRVVWCDGGEGLAERAATRLLELGYSSWEAMGALVTLAGETFGPCFKRSDLEHHFLSPNE